MVSIIRVAFILQWACVECAVFPLTCSLAVTSGRRGGGDGTRVVEYDEFGGLPQLENTYRAIGKASTIVALRTAENATVVSFLRPKNSAIEVPIGAQLLNGLVNPFQHLLVTGMSGDARMLTRYARQVVLNHTVAFEAAPSGTYLANEIGSYLQGFTVKGGTRPLAVHCYVVDGLVEHSLHEVDAAGNVAQVWAGVAGAHEKKGRDVLAARLNGTAVATVEVAKELAVAVLQAPMDLRRRVAEEDDEDPVDPAPGNNGTAASSPQLPQAEAEASDVVHVVLNDRTSE